VFGQEDASFVEEGVLGVGGGGEEKGMCWGVSDQLRKCIIVLKKSELVFWSRGGSGRC